MEEVETMDLLTIGNKDYSVGFDKNTGTLVKMYSTSCDWNPLAGCDKGLSFRLHVPLDEAHRYHFIEGENQKLTSVELSSNGCGIRLEWSRLLDADGRVFDVTVTADVSVMDAGIVFRTRIQNDSPYFIEAVQYPILLDLAPPKGSPWLKAFHYIYTGSKEVDIWPRFNNQFGYFGFDSPQQCYGFSPDVPFVLLHNEDRGLYFGVADDNSEIVSWNAELRPGWDRAIDEHVPNEPEIGGRAVQTRFSVTHMPYVAPGEKRDLTPIQLCAYRGTWKDGTAIYRNWLQSWIRYATPPAWVQEPHSWQQFQMNSPEDELRLRYADLPKIAAECQANGVGAIQLVGWNLGGQDQNNPSHDTDPRLGTWEELHDAIEKCRALGVKVILFSKFNWADRATERFRKDLIDCAILDPYGDYYVHGGYQYQTPAQMLDINTKRLIPMCFHSQKYQNVVKKEFAKLVALGADGMLYDECQHHYPTKACFAPEHGHRYGAPVYQKDRELIEMLHRDRLVPDGFLISGEACYAWEYEQYHLSYHRSEDIHYTPLARHISPRALQMTAVMGFNDRDLIDQCLLYRFIVSYEPFNFKGRLSDFPLTVAYGRKMDALRTELRKWLWDGEFLTGASDCLWNAEGSPYEHSAVFRAEDGSHGLVGANPSDEEVKVRVDSDRFQVRRYRTVDTEDWMDAGVLRIPPHSAIVII
jgi:hypothetical protein